MAAFLQIDTTTKAGWLYIKTNDLKSKIIFEDLYIQQDDVKGVRLANDIVHNETFVEILCNVNKSFTITVDLASETFLPVETFNGAALASNEDLFNKIISELQ